ncbi:nitronate monooxygenase [Streptomyces sp. NRRL S-146]|uniref:nitronate monooxygenase n=1 Tax=Streptomyces sp. NRRL S-146 TaxID=1463884 RepID=UPI0004C5E1B7
MLRLVLVAAALASVACQSLQLPCLVAAVCHALALPVIAAGGIAIAADVTAALRAGAVTAIVGTVLLLSQESGRDRGSGCCCALAVSDGRSQVGLESHGAWRNRRGATAGASIPPSAVGSWLPLA